MKSVVKVVAGLCMLCLGLSTASFAGDGDAEKKRLTDAGQVLKEILDMPDKGIPGGLLKGSECVIVMPSVKKAAFIVGGEYGRGVMSCRTGSNYDGPWSAPIMMASGGASFGLQIGGSGTDFVILVMNDKGLRSMVGGSKIKLGADASIAAGPLGRTTEAATNLRMSAEMLSWSRAQGVFGGVSLTGATLRVDNDADKNLYGKNVTAKEIMGGQVTAPEQFNQMQKLLEEKAGATRTPVPEAGKK
ncbi:MAG TPA: lipid-binding SYLF domain-containing protein [Candidatus Angelobacter sp.]